MHKTSRFVSILAGTVATVALAAAVPAAKAVTLPLNNANFDASGEETNGTGFSTSIGWSDANPNNPSGGIYSNSPAQSSPNAAYTTPGTFNGGYQLSDYVVQAGDQITLTYYAQVGWQSSRASVHLIDTTKIFTGGGPGSATQADPYSATAILATSTPAITGTWTQYTLTYTAVAADAGKILGLEFDNGTAGYINYDTFSLGVTHPFVHPGIAHSQADITRMRSTYTVEPYKSTWASILGNGYFSYNNTGQGPTATGNQFVIRNDATIVHCNAMAWLVTGDTRYRDNAITIMNGWARTLTNFDVTDHLTAGACVNDFCNGAEIIRATGGGAWAASDITAFQNMLTSQLLPALLTPGNSYSGVNHMGADGILEAAGHGIVQIQGLVPMGIFCDRPDIYSMGVISAERNASTSYGLLEYLAANGQNFESQRDVGHASGALGTYTVIAYNLLNQGIDLFALGNNRLAKCYESQAKFDLGYDVAPIPYTATDGTFHVKMSGDNRTPFDGLSTVIAYRIYNGLKGLQMPYTFISQSLRGVDPVNGIYPAGSTGPVPVAYGQPAPTKVTVYEDYLSGTYFPLLGPGSYNAAALSAAGVWQYGSGGVSSMRVPIGWTVTAYSGDNYTGSSVKVTGTLANQGIIDMTAPSVNFNDELTSMVITAGTQPYPIFNGTYQLVSENSGKVAEVPGSSTANGTALDQNTANNANDQFWSVNAVGHGQYSVQNLNSNLAMEVSGSSLSNGASLDQRTYTPEADIATGGTASASADNAGNGEGAAQAFDGNINTKWYDPVTGGTGWLQYQLASAASVDTYVLTSAGDVPQRDPASWQFQGSNNGTTWTTLDTETGQVFANRGQAQNYNLTNTTSYLYYRLNVTANSGGSGYGIQLAELGLFSSKSGAVNQRWTFNPVSGSALGSYFNVVNANSGLLMDVNAGSQSNGASIIQWPSNNGLNQRWSLQIPPLLLP